MQGVLFSWILVGELDVESQWVGIAQTATMLPSLFLLLIGGATADRFDPRRLLVAVHLLAPLPVLVLALAAVKGALSIPLVLAFALSMGTLTAFGNPARDALLSRVAGADLMGAVSASTGRPPPTTADPAPRMELVWEEMAAIRTIRTDRRFKHAHSRFGIFHGLPLLLSKPPSGQSEQHRTARCE